VIDLTFGLCIGAAFAMTPNVDVQNSGLAWAQWPYMLEFSGLFILITSFKDGYLRVCTVVNTVQTLR